jgi:hypothetical protein
MNNIKFLIAMLISTIIFSNQSFGQVKYTAKGKSEFVLTGTSTMHDWEMTSSSATCDATFTSDATGKLTGLTNMSFKTPAKSLKSGKGAMDKNAYKALKADSNPDISAVLTSATIKTTDNKNYTITSQVKLNIAGKSVNTTLVSNAKINADNTISVSGEKKIAMTDYDMKPPSFMLGSVKTGNDVVLKYNITLSK